MFSIFLLETLIPFYKQQTFILREQQSTSLHFLQPVCILQRCIRRSKKKFYYQTLKNYTFIFPMPDNKNFTNAEISVTSLTVSSFFFRGQNIGGEIGKNTISRRDWDRPEKDVKISICKSNKRLGCLIFHFEFSLL